MVAFKQPDTEEQWKKADDMGLSPYGHAEPHRWVEEKEACHNELPEAAGFEPTGNIEHEDGVSQAKHNIESLNRE